MDCRRHLTVSGLVVWILHLLPIRRRFIPHHYQVETSTVVDYIVAVGTRAHGALFMDLFYLPRGKTMKVMEVLLYITQTCGGHGLMHHLDLS